MKKLQVIFLYTLTKQKVKQKLKQKKIKKIMLTKA
jgi:hypothetical protein